MYIAAFFKGEVNSKFFNKKDKFSYGLHIFRVAQLDIDFSRAPVALTYTPGGYIIFLYGQRKKKFLGSAPEYYLRAD